MKRSTRYYYEMNDKASRKLNQKMNNEYSIDGRIVKVTNKFSDLTKKVMQNINASNNVEFLSALTERSSDNTFQNTSVFDKVMDYLSRIPDDISDEIEDKEIYENEDDNIMENVYGNFDENGGEESCKLIETKKSQPIDIPITPIEKNPYVGSPHIEYKINAITGQKYISNIFVNKPKLF
ncbi:Hypothetical protein SRAE_1000157500 [Strongyloides ratti]|uniref:Uncharacterized protein n=1 Tax=Strongyloides ratti TaxID=34506 RepID=A0A090MW16_STRRB|nr:Hypothetical protein SRAE_1000157500 [Strongyloides ratti]CEF63313.1 Hypothetical protein SRAE_1000157500 [Strongyloides ratti]